MREALFLLALLLPVSSARPLVVGIMMSTGVPSHQTMSFNLMRVLKRRLPPDTEFHSFQVRVFEFNCSQPAVPEFTHHHDYRHHVHAAAPCIQWAQTEMWRSAIPMDLVSIWKSPGGLLTFAQIIDNHYRECLFALENNTFVQDALGLDYDVIFYDHIFNFCPFRVMAALPRKTAIVPINYILPQVFRKELQIPSTGVYVPSLTSSLMRPYTFWKRLWSVLDEFVCTRLLEKFTTNSVVPSIDHIIGKHRFKRLRTLFPVRPGQHDVHEMSIYYLSPMELFLDAPKPTNYREKLAGTSDDTRNAPQPLDFAKDLGISELSEKGVVLLTFGSTANCSRMPPDRRDSIIRVLAATKMTIIWAGFFQIPADLKNVPPNVHLLGWVPQKAILVHPAMRLLITHGGFYTLVESNFRIPILYFPLHGDQRYRVARQVEAGLAEMLDPIYFTEDKLRDKVEMLLQNSTRYTSKLGKLGSMRRSLHLLEGSGGWESMADFRLLGMEAQSDIAFFALDWAALLLASAALPLLVIAYCTPRSHPIPTKAQNGY